MPVLKALQYNVIDTYTLTIDQLSTNADLSSVVVLEFSTCSEVLSVVKYCL